MDKRMAELVKFSQSFKVYNFLQRAPNANALYLVEQTYA
jgi:hypothetical protein